MGCDLQFVDFTWRPTCHLWEDEPSDNNGDCTRTREAATQTRHQPLPSSISSLLDEKLHLQEARLDTPSCNSPIDHKWRGEAEHNGDGIRQSEGPSRSPRAQALLGNLGRVGVADCRGTGGRECG